MFDDLKSRLRASNVEVIEDGAIPGARRFYIHDCFGNRLEIIGV
jgi:hypothetical protein